MHAQVAFEPMHYPQGIFAAPLDTPLELSATFGDLRSNHFHSGIDLRTNNEEGKRVYAAADGWIVRIKVSAFGYGRALYINHPNGYTTVYAHLKEFSENIENYTLRRQKARESYEVDLFPAGTELKVKKGQLIALSGNSGGSTGPHLHFEIRDSRTEATINPLLFGIASDDSFAPSVLGVAFCAIDEQNRAYSAQYQRFIPKTGSLESPVTIGSGEYGILLKATDFVANRNREMGWNYATLEVNGQLFWSQNLERFQFHETRLINAHLDYQLLKTKNEKWVKMWLDDGNKLPFFTWPVNNGKIRVREGESYLITIRVKDAAGYSDSVKYYIQGTGRTQENKVVQNTEPIIKPATGGKITGPDYEIYVPPGALFFPVAVYAAIDSSSGESVFKLFPENIALNKNIRIKIKPSENLLKRPSSLLIAKGSMANGISSLGGSFDNGFVITETKEWSSYRVIADTIEPQIKLISKKPLRFEIYDRISGISSYRTSIDGAWVLMEYDAKSDALQIHPSDQPAEGKKIVTVEVKDKKGNKRVFKQTLEF